MTDVLINPATPLLGAQNAVVTGRGVRRHTVKFTGPLSIKGVISGSATWETSQGRYELVPGAVLLLNDGEEYTLTIDALQPVETFNFFFQCGFVEDAFRTATTSGAKLLDAPEWSSSEFLGGSSEFLGVNAPRNPRNPRNRGTVFTERLHFDTPLARELQLAHARLRAGEPLAESFYAAALQLAEAECEMRARTRKLPALRASTREELARRVGVGTSFLHANLDRRVTVAEAAREACLSPFHFHRLFTSFHGVTPHRYVTRLRLERAKALLRATDRNVAEVALACGFESVGSFTSLFTRTAGVPPARFRRIRETA